MNKLNILITDDSRLIRKKINHYLQSLDFVGDIYQAENGESAIEQVGQGLKIDAVIMDINMPGIDGLTAMQAILDIRNIPCIIFSSFTEKNLYLTYEAIELGAFDVVHKPHGVGIISFDDCMISIGNSLKGISQRGRERVQPQTSNSLRGLVIIGVSTGGPKVLRKIIPNIVPMPYHSLVIVQHMPATSIEKYALRMNDYSQMPVKLAEHNENIAPGHIYLAPGGKNLLVREIEGVPKFHLQVPPKGEMCVPMIDYTFQTAPEVFQRHITGIVLTGMGRDGSVGAKKIKDFGGKVYIESEASCVVYGMPKAVKDTISIDGEFPGDEISQVINSVVLDRRGAA